MTRNTIELKNVSFRRPNGQDLNVEATVTVGLTTGLEPGGASSEYSEFSTTFRVSGPTTINEVRKEAAKRVHAHIKALAAHALSEVEAQLDEAAKHDPRLG